MPERLAERGRPGLLPVVDTISLADLPDSWRNLPKARGGKCRKEVVLDLVVEPTAEDRERKDDREVVRRFDLHRVPLAPPVGACTGGPALHLWADVPADDRGRRIEVAA